ncbi:helix-turn-helix transcriptional regulator [Streptomyces sp. NPDC002769]|uniref:helix-turn-helix domain-containing protein n=1 Tax=Streptomyces sp. NPDC002769 TaxID=3154542 RepID=UPI003333F01A
MPQDDANRLGEYLHARRDLVTPQQAGIPGGANRRVPGLRREEVAMLAGISADYYLRLERGRDHNPSPQVLQAIAQVLHLDDLETEYLLGLNAPRPPARRKQRAPRLPARLHHLLAAVHVPAFVEDRHFDVLACNQLAMALSPRLRPGENRLRSLLLDPEERHFQHDWEAAVVDSVAAFRRSVDDSVADQRSVELVGELSLASNRFRTLWARHDIKALGYTSTVNHPVVGELHLNREKLAVGDLLLVLYYPDQDSDAAEKLQLLTSLAPAGGQQPAAAVDPPTGRDVDACHRSQDSRGRRRP